MKILATTLALIIAAIGVTFLGLFTWNELNEDTDATWVEYQACIETRALEAWNSTVVQDEDNEDLRKVHRNDLAAMSADFLNFRAITTEKCAVLRPPLTTDNG